MPVLTHPYYNGELGWVAADPEHRGKRLGYAVCAITIKRILQAGYKHIYLLTDDFRLPALKIYLKQGWIPYINDAAMKKRWKNIFKELKMVFPY